MTDPSGASMVGLGGIFRALTLSFVGPCTIHTIESYIANSAFISVKGITNEGYLTDINPLEAEVKRAMIRQSERPVLLVDGRKFEQRGLSVVTHVSEVSLVLTADAGGEHLEKLKDLGVDVQSL